MFYFELYALNFEFKVLLMLDVIKLFKVIWHKNTLNYVIHFSYSLQGVRVAEWTDSGKIKDIYWLSSWKRKNNVLKNSKMKWSSTLQKWHHRNPEKERENLSSVIYAEKLYATKTAYIDMSELILVKNLINAHSVDTNLLKNVNWTFTWLQCTLERNLMNVHSVERGLLKKEI